MEIIEILAGLVIKLFLSTMAASGALFFPLVMEMANLSNKTNYSVPDEDFDMVWPLGLFVGIVMTISLLVGSGLLFSIITIFALDLACAEGKVFIEIYGKIFSIKIKLSSLRKTLLSLIQRKK